MRLEELKSGAEVDGILADGAVVVVDVAWRGSNAVELTYKDVQGRVESEILFRDDEARLELVRGGRAWSFDADGAVFRLTAEAYRIRLAHLFDPHLAVHTSQV